MTLRKSSRARPLSVNDRRELTVDAIIPLLSHMVARFRLVQKRIDTVSGMLRENRWVFEACNRDCLQTRGSSSPGTSRR